MNLSNFSYDTYSILLKKITESKTCLSFGDFKKNRVNYDFLLLRHDVDYSPELALKMARLEADLGIKATYFILLSSPHYNLLNSQFIQFPRKLTKMGHEVGLHYDVEVFEAFTSKKQIELLKLECELLSSLACKEVKSIAMHNPSTSGEDIFKKTNFINAYADQFTKEISYFSDSCGAWRNEFIDCVIKNDFPSQMQLLIHPIFWGSIHLSRWEVIDRFIQGKKNNLLSEKKLIEEIWSNHPGVIAHDERNNI